MEDHELEEALAGARRGDEVAFASLWRAFHPGLIRVTRALAGQGDADDVAAAVWVDVVRSLDDFRGDVDAFRGWLFTLARRRLIDLRRRQARRPEAAVGIRFDGTTAGDPADAVVAAEATAAALDLIASLPPSQAEVILLRTVAGLDVAAVARIVGKSPGAVRVLAHRGLANLRRELEGPEGKPDGPPT